jgi:hypothetical protein
MKLAKVVRSPFSPPGQLIVIDLPDDPEKVLVLPPETSDAALKQAEEMVKAHNDFAQAMDYIQRITSGNGG